MKSILFYLVVVLVVGIFALLIQGRRIDRDFREIDATFAHAEATLNKAAR